jgi:hypothetical protein
MLFAPGPRLLYACYVTQVTRVDFGYHTRPCVDGKFGKRGLHLRGKPIASYTGAKTVQGYQATPCAHTRHDVAQACHYLCKSSPVPAAGVVSTKDIFIPRQGGLTSADEMLGIASPHRPINGGTGNKRNLLEAFLESPMTSTIVHDHNKDMECQGPP